MSELNYETYNAGDVVVDSGATLAGAQLAYQTFGTLNPARDNAVVLLTHFGGTHEHCAHFVGKTRAIDPDKYFVIVINLLGNGLSSSPSNTNGSHFPTVTVADNVRLQKRLVAEIFDIDHLELVMGHSMGAAQTYHWAALFPDFVSRAAPVCGSAKTSIHNDIFLQGMRGILCADPAWEDGEYSDQPILGLRTMARAWAAWPPSSHFYRKKFFESLGFESADDFLERYWEATYTAMDANNVLTQISTWRSSDISNNELYGGDMALALASIKARVAVIPCRSDAYFPPEDSEIEVELMNNSVLHTIESEWGHWAGSGRNESDTDFINAQVKALLAS